MMRGNEAPMQVDSPRPPSALAGSASTSSSTAPGTPFSFGRSAVSGPSTPAASSGFTFAAPNFSTPFRTPATPAAAVKASRRSHYSDPPSPGLPRTPSDDQDEHERDEHENDTEPVTPAPSLLKKARQSLSVASESAKKLSAAVFTSTPARATPAAVPATPASTSGAADLFRTPSRTPSRAAAAARSRLSTTVTPRRTGPLRPRATPGTAPRPSKRARQASESGDEDEDDEDGDARSTTSYAMTPHAPALTSYHHAMASPMYSTPYAPPQMFSMAFTRMGYPAAPQPTDDESDLDDDVAEPAAPPALPPHLALLGYLHVLWNVLLASAGAYVVYTAYAAAAADLAHRFQAYTADEAAKIDECARQYVTNRCDPATRVPAVHAFCLDLEKCMHADPTRVPATALSAAAVAELIDAFVAKLSYKSLGFLLAIAAFTAMMNWACSCARPRASTAPAAVATSKPAARRARPQRTPMHHHPHAHHAHHPMYSPFANPYAGAYGSPMAYMSPAAAQHVPPTPGTAGSVAKRRMGSVIEEE
ncbi:hypothetical protein GGF32_001377 [Allomyces javanicus]|nr:hypothetical protein GGF32_001377 [Allomyces javanicus]